jgi:hypothetical protein
MQYMSTTRGIGVGERNTVYSKCNIPTTRFLFCYLYIDVYTTRVSQIGISRDIYRD